MERLGLADAQAGLLGDIFESSVAQVLEQEISHPDRGDEQVRQAVIVYVCEGSGHADLIFQANSRRGGDVFKLPVPQIAPKLVAPKLIDEINVEPSIAIHIGNGQAIAMIVMDGLVVFGRVIHRVMFKGYAALLVLIGKLEIVKNFPSFGGLNLLLFVRFQSLQRIPARSKRIDNLPVNDGVPPKQGGG